MALSELAVRKAQPKEKVYVLADEGGLALWVWPTGKKTWRIRYWIDGKERKRSLGEYPIFSLKEAREWRDSVRKDISMGKQPFAELKTVERTFGDYALEWWAEHKTTLSNKKNIKTTDSRVRGYIIPAFGAKQPADITPGELADFVKLIGSTGKKETANRVQDILRQIFRYIFELHVIERNPVLDITGVVPRGKVKHHPSITEPAEIAELRNKINAFHGTLTVKLAMLFSMYTFARPCEVRFCEWREIDFAAAEWHLPPGKMKAREKHIVPLSRQAIEVLKTMKPFSFSYDKYVFPAPRCYDGTKPYSDAAINQTITKRLKYPPRTMTAQGFRSMACTRLNESGLWHWDAIEAQLAHSEGNRVRKAYNYARYMQERREMMQWWADYIDGLKTKEEQEKEEKKKAQVTSK